MVEEEEGAEALEEAEEALTGEEALTEEEEEVEWIVPDVLVLPHSKLPCLQYVIP